MSDARDDADEREGTETADPTGESAHTTGETTAPDVLVPHWIGTDRTAEILPALREFVVGTVTSTDTLSETREVLPEVEIVITVRFDEELLDAAPNLEWVHVLSAGVNHLDLDAFREAGVAVTNSSGVHAEPIAEQVLASMLTFERNMHESRANQERGVWERVEGGELRGKTVGVIGVGAIGSRVVELCSLLGMETVGTKRDPSDAPDALDTALGSDEYPRLLAESDYVVLACPLTEETESMLGMPEFKAMGSDTVLVNIARGDVCDQDALVRALQYGVIDGAALDVFSEEPLPQESVLWDLSNVLITPHMAGSTTEKVGRWMGIIGPNYAAVATGNIEELENRVA